MQTELGRIRRELDLAKRSATDSLSKLEIELEGAKENYHQVCTELQAARESSSLAWKEAESLQSRLERSLKLEAKLKTQVKKGEVELESKSPKLNLSFLFFVCFPSDLCFNAQSTEQDLSNNLKVSRKRSDFCRPSGPVFNRWLT